MQYCLISYYKPSTSSVNLVIEMCMHHFLNYHSNTHISTDEFLSTNIPLSIIFLIAVLLLLLFGDIELNLGPIHFQSDCSIELPQNHFERPLSSKGISFVHLNIQSLLP